ncbi:hypothetical protein M758_4G241300 [Ceratodon purpureus]|nr:hypothetical protein M758_4G241300 [Ceratodon purpureus]
MVSRFLVWRRISEFFTVLLSLLRSSTLPLCCSALSVQLDAGLVFIWMQKGSIHVTQIWYFFCYEIH